MNTQKLMGVTYYDPDNAIRLTAYADTAVWDDRPTPRLAALRLGGYPEVVQALSTAICGGASIEIETDSGALTLQTLPRQYLKEVSHDGVYMEATLVLDDDVQEGRQKRATEAATEPAHQESALEEDSPDEAEPTRDLPPRELHILCPPGDRQALFDAVDQKTAAPLIPAFRDYVLDELERRGHLRPLQVRALSQPLEAWVLHCGANDSSIVAVLEDGLAQGAIAIPGGVPGSTPLDQVNTVTDYLNTFGVTVAERIKGMFVPLYDPSREPLSPEVLAVNEYVRAHAGYFLYDAQLAVVEAIKRRLQKSKVGVIVAECGTGKSKIGAATIAAAAAGLHASHREGKAFNLVLCPSHITGKWVREIEETIPNAFASVVHSIGELDRLYRRFAQGKRSCFAILSKELARDGYMRAPAVVYRRWNRAYLDNDLSPRAGVFCCPDCGAVIATRENGYVTPADSTFFRRENRQNHKCAACGAPLWSVLNPEAWMGQNLWGKIGNYGFVYRPLIHQHFDLAGSPAQELQLQEMAANPDCPYPARGAHRAYALSTYIKRRYKGRIYGLIVDELHQFSNDSGQGEAMAELVGTAKKVVGMTATLINGYSSGLFYLLYRLVPARMEADGQRYRAPSRFDEMYGVVQNVYEEPAADYHANRRTVRQKKGSRLLPGVSPLVYSRFLLECAVFLTLDDMGKDLPEYKEIPVALSMPETVEREYRRIENQLKTFLKADRKAARRVLSAYLNLLLAYPDQPYGQPPILHPGTGTPLVEPADTAVPGTELTKDREILALTARKLSAGEKVIIYTNWTRLDTQARLLDLLTGQGVHAAILPARVKPARREQWVADRLAGGLQVLIANPTLIETGLDLNPFTTLIFYDAGYKLFTLRQASRRSYRVNQKAPRVEVYFFYYAYTMQHKAIKLMANKLAAAGVIEGGFSEEGLAAMSECEDMATLMARELTQGIRDSVEDLSALFKRMAIRKAEPASLFQAQLTPRDNTLLRAAALEAPLVEFTFRQAPIALPASKVAVPIKSHVFDAEQLYLFKTA